MIAKQIAALEEQRTAKVKAMEDMVGKAEGEARGLNDDEKGTFADLKKSITDLDSRLDDLRATEKLVATKAAPVVVESPKASIQVGGVRREKGTFFARLAHALYMNQGNHFAAAEYAKSHLGDEELASVLRMPKGALERAASALGTTGDNAFAKPLTTIRQASEEFIDMLRPASVFARVPARRMNFDGNSSIVIPRQTAGASGTWVGEGAAIPVKKLAFDSINLTPKKMAVIVGVTNELLSHSSPAVEAIIRDDMIRSTATYLDTCFLDNTVNSSSRPGGLQVYDAAPTTSAGPTLADITTDLAALMADMLNANVPMNRPVWIMNPVNVNALMWVRDGLGSYAFRSEVAGGTLNGFPILASTSVPADKVFLVDADTVVVAEDLAPVIDMSEEAVLHVEDSTPASDIGSATPVRSLWQTDSVALRLRYRLDWNIRQNAGVQVLSGVAWSAAAG